MSIGPVQLLVLGFSEPNFSGEILAELDRLKDADTVRVIDGLAPGDARHLRHVARAVARRGPGHRPVRGRFGDPLDDRGELDEPRVALVAQEKHSTVRVRHPDSPFLGDLLFAACVRWAPRARSRGAVSTLRGSPPEATCSPRFRRKSSMRCRRGTSCPPHARSPWRTTRDRSTDGVSLASLPPDDGPAQCHPGESSAQSDQCLRVGSESRAETDRGGPRRVRERRSRPFPGCRPPDPLQALDLARSE